MATAYGIVTQSGGAIRCESTRGAGTRFEIVLPKTEGVVAPDAATPAVMLAPLMNGLALYDQIQQMHPGVATLLISGDSAPEVPRGPDGHQPRFLQKPFTPSQLLGAVRQALADSRVPTPP